MQQWLKPLIEALTQLIKELRGPLGLLVAYWGGRKREQAEAIKQNAETLRRALSAPITAGMSDDEIRRELERRHMLNLSGVQTNRGK